MFDPDKKRPLGGEAEVFTEHIPHPKRSALSYFETSVYHCGITPQALLYARLTLHPYQRLAVITVMAIATIQYGA